MTTFKDDTTTTRASRGKLTLAEILEIFAARPSCR